MSLEGSGQESEAESNFGNVALVSVVPWQKKRLEFRTSENFSDLHDTTPRDIGVLRAPGLRNQTIFLVTSKATKSPDPKGSFVR